MQSPNLFNLVKKKNLLVTSLRKQWVTFPKFVYHSPVFVPSLDVSTLRKRRMKEAVMVYWEMSRHLRCLQDPCSLKVEHSLWNKNQRAGKECEISKNNRTIQLTKIKFVIQKTRIAHTNVQCIKSTFAGAQSMYQSITDWEKSHVSNTVYDRLKKNRFD